MNRVIQVETSGPGRLAVVAVAIVVLIVAVPFVLLAGLVLLVVIAAAAVTGLVKAGFERLRARVRGDGRANVRVIR